MSDLKEQVEQQRPNLKVFNNFLSPENRMAILDFIGENGDKPNLAPFIYNPHRTYVGVDQDDGYGFQFVHNIFDKEGVMSPHGFDLVRPVLNFFNVSSIIRIKINANPRTHINSQEPYHTDHQSSSPFLSAVYYVNENNGGTQFKDGPFVRSVANRLLIFKGSLEHAGVTATDVKTRFVINFNFYSANADNIFDLPNYPSTIMEIL